MKRRQDCFTIVELMIATVVFSVLLLTFAGAIIQIGRLYYKGITSSRTQEVARTTLNEISQAIQFDPGTVVPTTVTTLDNGPAKTKAVCINTKLYSYRIGQQRVADKHALVVEDIPNGCQDTVAKSLNGTITGDEVLGDKMRLAKFEVTRVANANPQVSAYKVTIRVVYGDDDLVCSPSTGNCNSTAIMDENAIAAAPDLSCKNIKSGTQFCSVSQLSTIVERRLTND
jgi:type II secretory pathway pseudopilin PulG